jgi:hypothetical protein
VQFDTTSVATPAGGHHHAPEPFKVASKLATGLLAIVDTPAGERMRLTVARHAEGLLTSVNIKRPGGQVETLRLDPSAGDHHAFESTVAPAEPHEFEAELLLQAGEERDRLPFRMGEPEGHHH